MQLYNISSSSLAQEVLKKKRENEIREKHKDITLFKSPMISLIILLKVLSIHFIDKIKYIGIMLASFGLIYYINILQYIGTGYMMYIFALCFIIIILYSMQSFINSIVIEYLVEQDMKIYRKKIL